MQHVQVADQKRVTGDDVAGTKSTPKHAVVSRLATLYEADT